MTGASPRDGAVHTVFVALTVPASLIGKPESEVRRVLCDPRNGLIDALVAEVHRWINTADLSFEGLIENMRKLSEQQRRDAEGRDGH